ncbi:MAG TPA: tetratricopeptide repeat protein [Rhodanobacteraceae bacterium]|nr:tetratricopeptide repeat protein [Rhodanobacteraceae bacterium]
MPARRSLFVELRRRNVLRAAAFYVALVWALAQGISQLSPAFDLPNWATRWFVIACGIGFPFWVVFAWYYEITPQGIKRESEVTPGESITHVTARKLDIGIIAVLALAVVLLVTNQFVLRRDVNSQAEDADSKANAATLAKVPPKSIAVLPFENLSDDKSNEYFVAGMQDLILTKLADVGDLKVIARTSTSTYQSHPGDLKSIAAVLDVATILEGSVQKAGQQVLINVQLIDARTNSHIWAQDYTRNLNNIFGVEGEVAGKVAKALETRLSAAQATQLAVAPTTNPVAYDLFLRADFLTRRGLVNYDPVPWKAAIPLYRQAIANDPSFALAWARLSYTESNLYWFGGADTKIKLSEQARADAEQALKLAPNLAASQLAIGYSDYWGQGDYAGALKAFDAALALRPNDAEALAARGYIERRQGHADAAIVLLTQAMALDPRNGTLAQEIGSTSMDANRFAEAETWFQRTLALEPDDLTARVYYSNAILFGTGDVARALAEAQGDAPKLKLQRVVLLTYQRKYREAIALLESIPDTPDAYSASNTLAGSNSLQLARLYQLAGDDARARPLFTGELTWLRTRIARHQRLGLARVWQHIALAELGLGHTAEGLDAIGQAQAIVGQSADLLQASELTVTGASLYAQAQRADLAVPLLAKALSMPDIGYNYSPALLWIDPAWDPVRRDPRFHALLKKYANAAPRPARRSST